jgi:predicted nucleic acid-binding protein
MGKYVIGPDVAIRLAREDRAIHAGHDLLAPTIIRSQVLSRLYQAVQRSEITKRDAKRSLDYLRRLRIRLLGDRMLQSKAWAVAETLGWPDTLDAEYVALTKLRADAFVTFDVALAQAAKQLVAVAPMEALF